MNPAVPVTASKKDRCFFGQYSASVHLFACKCAVLSQRNLSFFATVLYCPNKTILFCKNAVLSPKNQSFGRPVVGSSFKTGQDGFFVFFWGQYSTFTKEAARCGADAVRMSMLVKLVYECSQAKRPCIEWSCHMSLTESVP